ncbi:sulfatase [Jejuia spongiicola]|uniref:Sulfatase n=1 Tax=Jejuia spongiicola TaxID=2942207 RepID=A0ABT0QI45_9FLAO|nr:sulfatase [Jejuia spongiicola]MCL6296666.1 sulfatase [Jejuia spongiicola]
MERIFTSLLIILILNSCKNENINVKKEKKPNVLFILVDDLGYKDLSCTGSTFYETPNIDKIANEGMIFNKGYAASRVCSPSRASIMTGKFTARHGITDWIGAKQGKAWRDHNRHDKLLPADYVHSLPKNDITIAEAMKASGYKTFFAGKWHLGKQGSYPEDHGFDINKGGWDKGSPIGGYFSPWKNPSLENTTQGENLSMRLAKETSKFIKKHKDTSFFAFMSFYAVHGPIQTTQNKWEKYRIKAEKQGIKGKGYKMERVLPIRQVQDNPIYGGLVEAMDDAVGHVLNTLKELGLDKNTIVIFTSDNGGVASGDNYSTSNLPLRGGKGYQWEGGIREPFFINVPWYKSNGTSTDYPVVGTDFYPTILDLIDVDNLPNQHIDGVSLKPLLEGKTLAKRALFWHYPHYGNQGGEPSSIIQEDGWKLIHYWEDGRNELYNLSLDINEQVNVASEHLKLTEQLSNKLNSWLLKVGANMPSKDLDYDEALAKQRQNYLKNEFMPKLEQNRLKYLSKDFEPNTDWWQSKLTAD